MIQDFDFHIHSSNSDGEHSVGEIVQELKNKNIYNFSITDHDNLDSIYQIKNEDIDGMNYINGIEFSCILDGKYKMHILGYNIDEYNEELVSVVEKLKNIRIRRFYEMVEILKEKFNIEFPKEEIEYIVRTQKVPAKPHLSKLLVKHGYVESVDEGFRKYMDAVKPKLENRIDAFEAITAINNAGGIAIWAHPGEVEKKYNIDLEEILPRLESLGLVGIEAFNSIHTLEQSKKYIEVANRRNLLVSGGSDFHGVNIKSHVKLGCVNKGEEVEKIDLSVLTFLNSIDKNIVR